LVGNVVDDLVVNLETPAPHRIRFGETNRFTGIALDLSGVRIRQVSALLDGRIAAHTAVDRESPEIGRGLPRVAGAERCRFSVELSVPAEAARLSFEAALADGTGQELFAVDLTELRRDRERLHAMARAIDAVPLPPPEIVALTQGHGDAAAYRESILPGIVNARRYLERSGFDASRLRSLLDFGCGSGRLLAGWHAEDPSRELFGCDIRPALVGWARENLPVGISVFQSPPQPPLALADGRFDLVLAVSVFTHLGLERQSLWAEEFGRLVRPGGALLATFHGEVYARLLDADQLRVLERKGFLENAAGEEGSNLFTAYHTSDFAARLFAGFELAGFFPSGRIGGERVLFPLASLQDVAVFQRQA